MGLLPRVSLRQSVVFAFLSAGQKEGCFWSFHMFSVVTDRRELRCELIAARYGIADTRLNFHRDVLSVVSKTEQLLDTLKQ